MKTFLWLVLISVTATVGASAASAAQSGLPTAITLPPLPHSIKGYELYSWRSDGRWQFALMTATNRLKSVAEITTGVNTAEGWVRLSADSLEGINQHLRRVPPTDEGVFWIGEKTRERSLILAGPIELPPDEIVDAIKAYCKHLGINLHVLP